jgi:hypothetical protein
MIRVGRRIIMVGSIAGAIVGMGWRWWIVTISPTGNPDSGKKQHQHHQNKNSAHENTSQNE